VVSATGVRGGVDGAALPMSASRMTREDEEGCFVGSTCLGSAGGGTAAWQVGRGHIVYVGSD
jgi:hypothetical protein